MKNLSTLCFLFYPIWFFIYEKYIERCFYPEIISLDSQACRFWAEHATKVW